MRFLGVPVESVIMMIFAPASIHHDLLSFSANFLVNKLLDFDYSSNISDSLIIARLKSLIPTLDA